MWLIICHKMTGKPHNVIKFLEKRDLPAVKLCAVSGLSYQKASPFFNLTNWSPMIHVNNGPIMPPLTGISASPPVYMSTSRGDLKQRN